MNESKSLTVTFFTQVLLVFAAAVIAVSIVGWLMGDTAKEADGLLRLGRDGLSYSSLLQLFLFSLVPAGLKVLLFSPFFSQKMLLLWRASLMFILSFLTAVLFSVFFQWFPLDNWEAWFGFFIAMTVSSAISILIMFVKIKMEDKKYSMLLSNYKAKQERQ